jgi:predicted permease
MRQLWQDLRYTARHWIRKPGFALVVVLTLALGIGANAAIFSVVDAVLLKPLPYPEPERLVQIYSQFPNLGFDKFWISPPEYLELREWARSYDAVGAYVLTTENVAGGELPMRARTAYVTAPLWRALGVDAEHGRTFTEEEDGPGADPVVLLSHGFWQRTFGADPELVGNTVEVDGKTRTVVGILPPEVDLEDSGVEVWLPLAIDPANPGGRGSHFLYLIGRLGEGVPLAQAREEMEALLTRWEEQFGGADDHAPNTEGHRFLIQPLKEEMVGEVRPAMLLLLGAVGLVLLIACANVANLLLARAEARQREIAIRTALGANHGRLVRQFLTESVALAVTGGLLGLGLAFWGLKTLVAAYPESVPRIGGITLDLRVLAFTVAASLVTGLVFGLAPALHARTRAFFNALREGGRSSTGKTRQWFRRGLVVAEVALAAVLVVGAGLLLKSFWTLTRLDPGFDAGGLLSFQIELPASAYPEPEQVASFYDRLIRRLETLPGVESAAAAAGLPPQRSVNANTTQFESVPDDPDGPPHNVAYYQFVSPGYFATLGIPVIEGRGFAESDAPGDPPVVVINQTMAKTFWPDRDPVGQRLRRGWWSSTEDSEGGFTEPWHTIVGVVADVKQGGMDQEVGTELYFLHRQVPAATPGGRIRRTLNLLVRTAGDPLALAPMARAEVGRMDPALPVANVRSMETVVSDSMVRRRFLSLLVGLFAGLALLLAAVGTYGVLSYAVEERRYEMGVRMALGARGTSVLMLVLRQGMGLVLAGLAVGVGLALLLREVLASQLYGVEPTDPVTYAVVAAVLVAVAFVACLVPAGRAMRTDPVVALKSE